MFVKYDENGRLTALLLGCEPEDKNEYTEIPDDEEMANAFFAEQRAQAAGGDGGTPTWDELAEAIKEGVNAV